MTAAGRQDDRPGPGRALLDGRPVAGSVERKRSLRVVASRSPAGSPPTSCACRWATPFCVKRALPKLKVAAIGTRRSSAMLEVAGCERRRASFRSRPPVLGHDPARGDFAMEYLLPEHYPVWKTRLRDGMVDPDGGRRRRRARPHPRRDRGRRPVAAPLRDRRHLPGDPARALSRGDRRDAHPDLAGAPGRARSTRTLPHEARRWCTGTSARRTSCRDRAARSSSTPNARGTAIPAFDLAFCLNHLLLKGAWTAGAARRLPARCFDALRGAYRGARPLGSRRTPSRRAPPRCCPRCCCAGRRQVAGRVPRPAERTATAVRASRAALVAPRPSTLAAARGAAWERERRRPASRHRHRDPSRRRVWDSRGRPTVEVEVALAAAPAAGPSRPPGASRGIARGGRPARRRHALRRPRRAQGASPTCGRDRAARCSARDALDQARHRRGAHRARRHAEQVARSAATRWSRPRWPCCTPPPRRAACRSGGISPATAARVRFRCRRSRSSAAAPMPAAASTCRTSW